MVAGATSLTLILATVPQSVGATESEESTTTANVSLVTSVPEPCTLLDDPSDDETPQADATSEASSSSEASAPSQPEVSDSPEPSPSSSAPTPTTAPALESPAPAAPSTDAPSLDARELDLVTSEPSATVDAPATTAPESDAPESEDPTANPSETAVAPVPAPASASPSASEASTPSATASPSPTSTSRVSCVDAVTDATAVAGDMSVALSWVVPDGADDTYVTVGDGRIYKVPAPLAQLEVTGLRNGKEVSFTLVAANTAGSGESVTIRATPVSGTEGEVAGIVVAFDAGTDVRDGQQLVPGEERVFRTDLSVNAQIAEDVHVIDLADGVTPQVAEEIATQLEEDPRVVWAEPDMFVSPASEFADLTAIDDSEYTTRQWNLWDTYGVGVGQGATSLADEYVTADGTGASVAVIDTGITSHPDLDPRIDPGFDFVSSPIELASPRVPGGAPVPFDGDSEDEGRYGALGWDANPQDPGDWSQVAPARDSSWHGTHVAGIIAAQPDGEGTAGIAPGARIVPVRALSWRGGLMSDVAAAITWSTGGVVDGVAPITKPVDVVNMSFAMRGMCPATLQSAITGAIERGATLVAAAGNANEDVAAWAPANCEGVIAVAATGRDGKRAPYSNWGAGIDVSAPGGSGAIDGGVVSTSNTGLQGPDAAGFVGREGTSVAAAHVASIAARVAGARPEALPADIHAALVGRASVRAFADDVCDIDPARTCGSGIAQIAALSGEAGVDMAVTVGSTPVADGSTVAVNSVVTLGTAGLLSPGVGNRELRTTLHAGTVYRAGSAEAPEGWTIQYSTNNGTSWSSSEPGTASSVTDVRATKTAVAAGLIEGTSQVYSTETSSAIPSSTFLANAGGDGFDAFFYEDQVFNIFHHNGSTYIMCHVKSTSQRCPGFSSPYVFSGYQTSMRSTGWVDASTGRLYAYSVYSGNVWVVCLNVSTSTPVSCGTTQMTTQGDVGDWTYLSEGVAGSGRFFATESGSTPSLLCFDAATQAPCTGSPMALNGTSKGSFEQSIYRPGYFDGRVFAITDTTLYCVMPTTLATCSGSWPVTVSQWMSGVKGMGIAPHVNSSQVLDGVCYFISFANPKSCLNLDGTANSTWNSPFTIGVPEHPHIALGIETLGRFYYGSGRYQVGCWDYTLNAKCTDFGASLGTTGYKNFSTSVGIVYGITVDPQNPACLWMNSDAGYIYNFDAYTGVNGCSSNPVITLQPSQFAPRYACSTDAGITEWTALRLVSLAGGGSASTVKLTVRKASGEVVTGWSDVPVTLGQQLDMTGLNPSVSGSRPTFSFAFSGITGSITTAVIALDYKGKGPELCVDTTATATEAQRPLSVSVTGKLTESVGAEETFTTTRSFLVGTSAALLQQTVPSAPRALSGTGLNTTATLTFQAPASDGNSAITGYQYSIDGGSTWSDATTVDNGDGTYEVTVSGLVADRTYSMAFAAVNAIGRGASATASVTTQLVTIDTLADTPVNQGPIALRATSSQGLAITYTASPSSVCTVSGSTVTLVGMGTCSLVANQAGDPSRNILPATDSGSFQVLAAYYEPTVPGVPTSLALTPGNGQVSLSWTAPAADGYTPITDYSVQYKSGSSWIPFIDGVSTGTTAIVSGLTNGTTYSFRVAAVNARGTGEFTATQTSVPATVPGAPTSLAATGSGTSRTLTWTAPASTGGTAITDYVVEFKPSTDATWTTFADAVTATTGATVTGLTNGVDYDFQVTTKNAVGLSTSTSTVNLTATPGAAQVTLAWSAPASPGGTITDYEIEFRENGTSAWTTFTDGVSSSTGGVVTGLTNGTAYNFRVATILSTGVTSSYTSVVTATPRTTPSAPSPSATPGNRQIALSWTAPGNGGSAITDYTVEYKASSSSSWTTFTDGTSSTPAITVTGLLNGTGYDFRVTSTNAVGTSSTSSVVSSTPRTTPGAPTSPAATAGDQQVTVTWTAPTGSSTGGSAITDYVVETKLASALTWTTVEDGVSTSTSATITGLANGTAINVRVSAVNAAGTGTATTTLAATPRTTPGAPSDVAATVTTTSVTLTWDAPASDGGSAITDYIVKRRVVGDSSWTTVADGTSTSRSATVTGLTTGTSYEFTIAAVNAAGTGSASDSLTTTPSAVPGAATGLVIASGSGTMLATWAAPFSNGGAAISDYVIQVRQTASSLSVQSASWQAYADGTSPATSATLSGFTPGTTYEVRVAAVNVAGTGPFSDSASGTPGAVATSAPATAVLDNAPAPTVTTEAPAPVEPPVILPGSSGVILIDGVPSNVDFTPTDDSSGWLIQAPDFSLSFRPQASDRPNIELGPSRQLIAPVGGWVLVRGDGYQGSSRVSAYLIRRTQDPRMLTLSDGGLGRLSPRNMAETRYVGEADVAADGTFNLKVDIPTGMQTDNYVLQVNGTSPALKARSVNMALTVTASLAPRKGKVVKKAFFAPRSGKLTAEGRQDLITIASRIPKTATNVMVEVTGVSVSMGSIDRDIDLAAKRAKRIVRYLQDRGVSGTYQVSFMTSMTTTPQLLMARSGPKPLTTVNISYVVPTG